MRAFLPSTDPESVEATIDSYRRLGPKSYLLAFAARNVFRMLVQIDQVASGFVFHQRPSMNDLYFAARLHGWHWIMDRSPPGQQPLKGR